MEEVLEKLSLNKDLLSSVIEEIPTGIVVLDDDWNLIFANKTALTDLETSFDALKDLKWVDWLMLQNENLNLKVVKRILGLFWKESVCNKKIRFVLDKNKHLIFLVSVKKVTIDGHVYRIVVGRETTKEHKHSLRAIQFHNSFRRELKVAKLIQKTINNSILHRIVGKDYIYHFYSKFIPSQDLSGDVMNVNQINRRYFSVFLGDGKGHGLPAALYSSLIYSYINLFALEVSSGEEDIVSLVNLINQLAYKDFTKGEEYYFFSGVFILIDGDNNRFSIVNAGHPRPFYIESNQKLKRLGNNGPILGVSKDASYSKTDFEAQDGQTFLLYTDGLLAMDDGENQELTQRDIFHFLNDFNRRDGRIDRLLDALIEFKLQRQNGYQLQDDISVMIMKVQKKNKSST